MLVGAASLLLLILLMAGVVWAFSGLEASLIAVVVVLLLVGAYHVWNLYKLVGWTRQPPGTPPPGAVGLWDLVFSDLTRYVRASTREHEQLSAALDRFREAGQAMPHGLMFLSTTHTIEWVNRQGEQQFGLDKQRDQGTAVTHIVRQPDFVRYLQQGDYAEPLIFRQSRGRALMVHVVPFGTDMLLLMSEDITQGERLEAMRRDFVANVSHEMRTPLTVVTGFLETVLDSLDELEQDDIRYYLGLAAEQAGRMQRLIQDLLTLSSLEAGAPMPREERVDVPKLLREIHQEAELVSGGKHEITLDCSTNAHLLGSSKELYSAFINLAVNAVRYTPPDGHIRIFWRQRGALVEYGVEDDGIGIAAEDIPRLTERFYRVDRGRSRETGGTGLGLAIVKHVVNRHQGDLLITSEPGAGSCFTASFPVRRIAA
ncbi:phosphate regulon sensor histidine kinase PhoR [Zoogloea sp.]|uniref:phosphate regulon sensor histidine kinase PhoR n=1 Tax=Zoogloea sp. TaxID=49181 RepID=UPI0035B13172|nr:phosphate regulon sensor histidine kinase PhoR [Rhodocyclales bacterium]